MDLSILTQPNLRDTEIVYSVLEGRAHIIAIAITMVAAILECYLMLTPIPDAARPLLISDKAIHLIAFSVLAAPLSATNPLNAFWLVPSLSLSGGIIELLQPFVGREAEWWDFIFNGMGAVLGAFIGTLGYLYFRRRFE